MNRAVFLDRDGTINVEKNYLYKIEDFEFLPNAITGLKLLQNAGYLLVIVTNQSGIARGYYTEEDLDRLNDWMLRELEKQGVRISAIYYCPHMPEAKIVKYRKICNCRKPAVGLYEEAVEDFNIAINKSWAIGDKLRDCSICSRTACRGYLIGANENPKLIEAVKNSQYRNIEYAQDLFQAAQYITAMTSND